MKSHRLKLCKENCTFCWNNYKIWLENYHRKSWNSCPIASNATHQSSFKQSLLDPCFRKYQMRVPIELLSGLANCLLNDTIFEIVKGLMEIQHVTEKHLFQQRLQVINQHTRKLKVCTYSMFVQMCWLSFEFSLKSKCPDILFSTILPKHECD